MEHVIYLIYVCGAFHFLLALFHLTFWYSKKFNWQIELPKISSLNAVLLKESIIANIVFLLIVSFLCVFDAKMLAITDIGFDLFTGLVIFWLVRLICEFYYKKGKANFLVFAICLIGILISGIVASLLV